MGQNGKITRLPHEVREQLNRRMKDGEEGKGLIEWLNGLPEVRAVLAEEFDGQPIGPNNLSQYRKRGFWEWVNQQEALAEARRLACDAGEVEQAVPGALSDRFATWIAARYAVAAAKLGRSESDAKEDWQLLRELCHDMVNLRRGDHYARQLGIEEKRMVRSGGQSPEELAKLLRELARTPEVRVLVLPETLTAKEKKEQLRKIFGLKEDYTPLTDAERIDMVRKELFGTIAE